MTLFRFSQTSAFRVILASLLAWPITGILTSLVFSQTPKLDSEKDLPAWTAVFRWVWLNLFAIPLYGGAFLGHFVFLAGLFLLAKLMNRQKQERKAARVATATLLAGVVLKAASYTFLMGWHWETLLLVLDSLAAILVVYLTQPRASESLLVL